MCYPQNYKIHEFLNLNELCFISVLGACLYKGKVHQQGDTWQDGCDYECECTDASRGQYKCNERYKQIHK